MCLYPKLIRNPRYTETKKNGGELPPIIDKRVLYVPIGCGRCMECKKKKMNEWKIRLIEEAKENNNGKFVTLTFNQESLNDLRGELILELNKDCERITNKTKLKYEKANLKYKLEGYDLDNAIATLAVRKFMNRWRKEHGKVPKYFLITELGHEGTERLHLHGIIWDGNERNIKETGDKIERIWKYGWVWKYKEYRGMYRNYVAERTINYISKYMLKLDEKHREYTQIILCSNGIGKGYIKDKNRNNRYKDAGTNDNYIKDNGSKTALPIYYRNKLYTDEEKEKLWIERLDKNVRWVNGQKIDISKGMEEYWKILKQEQTKNKLMGYRDSSKNWERIKYEHELRLVKQEVKGLKIKKT
nr:MAG: replication initiator protein [Microviridae sp.]